VVELSFLGVTYVTSYEIQLDFSDVIASFFAVCEGFAKAFYYLV